MLIKFQKFTILTGFALLIAFGLATVAQAQTRGPIILTDEVDEYPLGLHLEILEDPTGELTIEQVSSLDYDGRFAHSQEEVPNYGHTDSAYWVRFRVKNEANPNNQWRLINDYNIVDHIDFYFPIPDESRLEGATGFGHVQTGRLLPFDTQDVPDYRFVFELPLPSGTERCIYVRFQSESSMTLDLTIKSLEVFTRNSLGNQFRAGFFYGALLIMLGYNLFLAIVLREESYLYYVLFLASFAFTFAAYEGLARQYLWPNVSGWNRGIPLGAGLFSVSLFKFTSIFLRTSVYAPRWHRLITTLTVLIGLLTVVVPFFSYSAIIRPIAILVVLGLLTVLGVSFVVWRRGYRPARYYSLAWVSFLSASALTILTRMGLFPSTSLIEYGTQVGVILLVLLLSFALADRINVIRQEKAKAEAQALQMKAENARMEAELGVTRQLQQMLLPTEKELGQIEGLDVAGFMEPAEEVGGDYYDVLQHNGQLKIGIGDVTGHGLESGIVMLMLQTAVRTLLTGDEKDPVRFMNVLNRTLHDNMQRMDVGKSMSLTLLDCELGQRKLNASGQHEQMLVVRQGGQVEMVDTLDLGFPLGLEPEITRFVDETSIELQPGDGIVLYSDGITEAENAGGEFYGMERLCDVVSVHWTGAAKAVKDAVVADVRGFIGEQMVYDDLTLLVIKQLG